MPIYEFICANCSNEFEEICSVEISLKKIECPKCLKKNAKKKVSGFAFKSSGKSSASLDSGSGCSSCSTHNCSSCN